MVHARVEEAIAQMRRGGADLKPYAMLWGERLDDGDAGPCGGARGQHDADETQSLGQLDRRRGCRLARGGTWGQHDADGAQPRTKHHRRCGCRLGRGCARRQHDAGKTRPRPHLDRRCRCNFYARMRLGSTETLAGLSIGHDSICVQQRRSRGSTSNETPSGIAGRPHRVTVASPFPLKLFGIWSKRQVNTNRRPRAIYMYVLFSHSVACDV
jgi:hypothetical protein